jgi:hypothetical protein
METSQDTPAASEPTTIEINLPATFLDGTGREWRVAFRSSLLEKIKAAHGVDFWEASNLTENGPFVRTGSSERLLIEVAWMLCEEQAKAEGLTKDDFADLFYGEVFDAAYVAMQGGLLVFFSGAHAALFRKSLAELKHMGERQQTQVEALYKIGREEEEKISAEAREKWRLAIRKAAPAQVSKLIEKSLSGLST